MSESNNQIKKNKLSIFSKIRDLFQSLQNISLKTKFQNIVYYPGCMTKFVLHELENNYVKILETLNLDYIVIDNEFCCGSPVYHLGSNEYFQHREHLKQYLMDFSPKIILANCPACTLMLKSVFENNNKQGKLDDENEDHQHIQVKFFLDIIYERWKNNEIKILKKYEARSTYHDPCHLGKKMNYYDIPRELIKSMGFNLIEMQHNRENSMCCGAGSGLINYDKELANKIARMRIKEALETRSKFLITACPMCYFHLKNNLNEMKKENKSNNELKELKIYEISELLVNCIEQK